MKNFSRVLSSAFLGMMMIALMPREASAQFASLGSTQPEMSTRSLVRSTADRNIYTSGAIRFYSSDYCKIYATIDSCCNPPGQRWWPAGQIPPWYNPDLKQIADILRACCNSGTIDSLVNFKVDSVNRHPATDSVFYYTNGTQHFAFIDSIGFVQENSAQCNFSAGFGTMNVNNNSSSNTNVGINAGHNIIFTGLRNTNFGCNAGTGTFGGDDNVYIGYNTGNTGNFSNVTAIGTALTPTASGQTLFPAVSGDVYFGGISSAGAFANLILQGGERTGPNASGNSVTLKGGRGTGTGTPGDINLFTYNSTGSSGSTPQTGTTKLVVKGNGNVGIGTTSPTAKLHLSNGAFKYENGSQGLGKVLYDSTGSGDVTYITLPTIETGHYLPSVTLTSNLDTVVADSAKYSRVGDIVTVSGRLSNVTPTAISFQCDFTITLPLLSTTTDKFDVSGTGNFEQFNTQDAAILASGFEARFLFTAVSITQDAMDYIYQYTIK